MNELNNKGIETRPIISGNFLKYPVTKFLDYKIHGKIKNSKEIDKNGFFIGNNHVDISRELEYFEDTIIHALNKNQFYILIIKIYFL